MESEKTQIVAASLPVGLATFAKAWAKDHGVAFSAVLKEALAKHIGYEGNIFVQNGGDRSRFKSEATHARVCEKMREAKAKKQMEAQARVHAEIAAEVARRKTSREREKNDRRETA